jgi:hypothetical protein
VFEAILWPHVDALAMQTHTASCRTPLPYFVRDLQLLLSREFDCFRVSIDAQADHQSISRGCAGGSSWSTSKARLSWPTCAADTKSLGWLGSLIRTGGGTPSRHRQRYVHRIPGHHDDTTQHDNVQCAAVPDEKTCGPGKWQVLQLRGGFSMKPAASAPDHTNAQHKLDTQVKPSAQWQLDLKSLSIV